MSNPPQTDYQALVVTETDKGQFNRQIQTCNTADLPPGELLVRVQYSSLNYKDALSATGNKGVTRQYPHTPGIDAAGIIEHSDSPGFSKGDPVIVTGFDLGMNTAGGFGQYIRIPADWAIALPAGLSLHDSMIYGTAGLTAAMSVNRIVAATATDAGEILVTGATGGVGSMAVAILAQLGYRVTAVTGKASAHDFLRMLGAEQIIDRSEFMGEESERPMLKTRWAGVIDTVGGELLTTAIKSTRPLGMVTCCGNVASPTLSLTVYPFILRGITLTGIDSQNCPMPLRRELWNRLADAWRPAQLNNLFTEITLEQLDEQIMVMLQGKQQGRTLVNLDL